MYLLMRDSRIALPLLAYPPALLLHSQMMTDEASKYLAILRKSQIVPLTLKDAALGIVCYLLLGFHLLQVFVGLAMVEGAVEFLKS